MVSFMLMLCVDIRSAGKVIINSLPLCVSFFPRRMVLQKGSLGSSMYITMLVTQVSNPGYALGHVSLFMSWQLVLRFRELQKNVFLGVLVQCSGEQCISRLKLALGVTK